MANSEQLKFANFSRIVIYPKVHNRRMFIAFCHLKGVCKSEGGKNIFSAFFDSLGAKEKTRLLNHYEKMTSEERRNPGRILDDY